MSDNPAFEYIKSELEKNDIVLFMKGSPLFPQCGFSATAVEILNRMAVPFKGINVLSDDTVRNGIKEFSDWPTIPQLYVKGEFVGGCDIMREMYETGELHEYMKTKGFDPEYV
ncbi:Grx4 family monothiol glutaredoxin [Iodidimonas sp. SYSU 1G8]|uniref:Grx4 family monothiol glutaredoxin n=1 Tax=Iodidimonas sp. SYSU 1G8 TaxID=3133967 RepID=UPI0031FE67DF